MTENKTDKKIKIVLVEDDKFISLAYKDGLTRAGFNVIHAADGIEGIEKIMAEKPDLVLLDIIMPGKNGFEVMEEIKKHPETKEIPVIFLSNLSQDADIKKGKKMGAVDYWVKSNLSLAEMVEKINNFFK